MDDASNAGAAAGDTFAGIEELIGSRFADRLVRDRGGNRLTGLEGGNVLGGCAGDDVLAGGLGGDVLVGGGADRFRFVAAADSGPAARDTIRDFSRSAGDRIDLRAIDADEVQTGDQAFVIAGTEADAAVEAGSLFVRVEAGGTGMVLLNTDGDSAFETEIQVAGLTGPSTAGFLL